jgi:hypothetical protein
MRAYWMSEVGKIPALDKGFVQLRCCAPNFHDLEVMKSELFRGNLTPQLIETVHVYLNVKCPYFLLIPLLSSGIKAISRPGAPSDAYVPRVDDIKSGNHESDLEIQYSMNLTIDSLMLNQKAYAKDGCNPFVASVTTPVAAYWEGVMFGLMRDWVRFAAAPGLHPLVKEYQKSVVDALSVEYKNINDIMRIIPK